MQTHTKTMTKNKQHPNKKLFGIFLIKSHTKKIIQLGNHLVGVISHISASFPQFFYYIFSLTLKRYVSFSKTKMS